MNSCITFGIKLRATLTRRRQRYEQVQTNLYKTHYIQEIAVHTTHFFLQTLSSPAPPVFQDGWPFQGQDSDCNFPSFSSPNPALPRPALPHREPSRWGIAGQVTFPRSRPRLRPPRGVPRPATAAHDWKHPGRQAAADGSVGRPGAQARKMRQERGGCRWRSTVWTSRLEGP